MKIFLKKHVVTGVGSDLFIQKECEMPFASVGMLITWGGHMELVKEITVNLDKETMHLWTEADYEVERMRSKDKKEGQVEKKLDALAVKMRDYQNRGWVLER